MAPAVLTREITHVVQFSAQLEQLRQRYDCFYWFFEKTQLRYMSSRSRNFVPRVHPSLVHSQSLSESTVHFSIGAQTFWTAVRSPSGGWIMSAHLCNLVLAETSALRWRTAAVQLGSEMENNWMPKRSRCLPHCKVSAPAQETLSQSATFGREHGSRSYGSQAMGGKFLSHRKSWIRTHDLKYEKFMLILFYINHSTDNVYI